MVGIFRRSLWRLLLIVAAIIGKRKPILTFLSANVHLYGSYLDGEVQSL
ncbi:MULTISPECIES: hypothetical protein [Microcystis]|nr:MULTISPECIES: hypothetical protein [Microcystis]